MSSNIPNSMAQINKPKVGNCYNYSAADVSGDGSTKGPVKCSSTHTAETYRVSTWPDEYRPFDLTLDEEWAIANEICQPWTGNSRNFNYWAYYLPTKSQWAAGQRWLRCDAMKTTGRKGSDHSYASWKGKRLDVR